jgi:hypothetical protein
MNWKQRLTDLLEQMHSGRIGKEMTLSHIFREVGAPSQEELALELLRMQQSGDLVVRYKVLSPETREGLEEYERLKDIPSDMYDESTDRRFRVVPSRDLEIVYRAA